MYLIIHTSTDPYYNLAAEEYLLEHFDGDVVMLWRNDKAVVVGKNQNALEEVDADYLQRHQIALVRRLTGGGAVFHDLGNVNFTVIRGYRDDLFCDYAGFTEPVCRMLRGLGVDATLSGRNDLLIDGMKFSGNAQTKYGKKIMHHGTLLFSSAVEDISGALRPDPSKFESKSVKSVRSRVTNISAHLAAPMTVEQFFDALADFFRREDGMQEYTLTDADKAGIAALADAKYRTWEWDYGASPPYTARNKKRFPFGSVDLRLEVRDGIIKAMTLYGDFFGREDAADLCARFCGCPHNRAAVDALLAGVDIDRYISGIKPAEFAELIF